MKNPRPSPDGNEKPRGNKPVFPGATERPTEAPDGTTGKMAYDRELEMHSRTRAKRTDEVNSS